MLTANALQAATLPLPKVISTNVCADELLLDLADPQQILAVTHYAKPRHQNILADHAIPTYHGQTEEVLSLHPDLVLTGAFDAPLTSDLFKQFQIKTLALELPKNFRDINNQIDLVGKALHQEEKAQRIILHIQEKLKSLNLKSNANQRAVFWGYEGHVPGKGTYENAMLEELGLVNIADDFGIQGHGWISIEKMIQAKPDILILENNSTSKNSVGEALIKHAAIKAALPNLKLITLEENSLRCGGVHLIEVLKTLQLALENLNEKKS